MDIQKTSSVAIPEETQENKINKQVNDRQRHLKAQFNSSFQKYMNDVKKKQIQNGLRSMFARFSIQNQEQLLFQQQWQSKSFQLGENTFSQIIQLQTLWSYIYASIILLLQSGFLWYISSFRLLQFAENQITLYVLGLALVIFTTDTLVRIYLRTIYQQIILEKKIFLAFKSEIYVMVYCVLNIIFDNVRVGQNAKLFLYLLDFITLIAMYKRVKIIWQHIKIISYTTYFKYHFKLIDLLATLLIFSHLFALLLYLSSFYDVNNSWTSKINEQQVTNASRYFYAFYFSCTTMLTIGFGDLIPLNKMQVVTVLMIQILGAANLSFIINQIGFTMGLIRKQEEQLQKNLSTLSKMSKFYRIQRDFAKIIKQNIISNRKQESIVYPQDQDNVLMKLNEDLREKMILQNSASVLKSCSFFICHWTKYFQAQIAKKLIKKILHPNEIIYQLPGKQKIYIIKSGKIQLYTNRSSKYKQLFKKQLKVISPDPNQAVADNVYGYTNVISSKPIKLSAISKEFTSVFVVDKEHFMNCVNSNKLDYQYYFEIKDKIDRAKCPQAFQAPTALNALDHFKPNQLSVIKHHLAQERKHVNLRKQYVRVAPKKRLIVKSHLDIELQRMITPQFTIGSSSELPLYRQQEQKTQTIENDKQLWSKFNQELLVSKFEDVKQYFKYFQQNNVSKVLKKMELGFPMFKGEAIPRKQRTYKTKYSSIRLKK